MIEHMTRRHRYSHMRRSTPLIGSPDSMTQLVIKWADTQHELEQAFSLVHEEYLRAGYIRERNPSRIFFNIHNLLPNSSTLIIRNHHEVIATLSIVMDGQDFGLPMDALYEKELERLRSRGRKICELCTLAVSSRFHSQRLYLPLFRAMYWHAVNSGLNETCIIVNPRHVSFYKVVFLFEDFGPEKFYPRVQAPAVCLRLNLDAYGQRLKAAYKDFQSEFNLYSFFYDEQHMWLGDTKWMVELNERQRLDGRVVHYFLQKHSRSLGPLAPGQLSYFAKAYPGSRMDAV